LWLCDISATWLCLPLGRLLVSLKSPARWMPSGVINRAQRDPLGRAHAFAGALWFSLVRLDRRKSRALPPLILRRSVQRSDTRLAASRLLRHRRRGARRVARRVL